MYDRDPGVVHPRFLRAELRLSRINTIHRFTRFPPFHPYIFIWNNYSSLVDDYLTWITTTAVLIALVLAAMQVGLATEQLQGNATFQQASYGFAVFAILGPLCAFGGLVALPALFNLVNVLLSILREERNRRAREIRVQVSPSVS